MKANKGFDPRLYQIAALSGLLAYGLIFLALDVTGARCALVLAAALLSQRFWTWAVNLPFYDPKSALISGLSLCLLLRSNSPAVACLSAVLAVSSKFIFRFKEKHLFNPTNFSIVVLLLLLPEQVWVSPGQWGQRAFLGFLLICIGGWVVRRASRMDITLAFLGFYLLLLFGRSWWLHEPMTIPWHRTQNGALLIFAFFMISDPKSTPDSRVGRIIFALLVAAGGWWVQFKLFRTNGLLWSLALFSLMTPVLDWLFPGKRYQWVRPPASAAPEIHLPKNYEPIAH